jgi:hypothetical protein
MTKLKTKEDFKNFIKSQNSYEYDGESITHSAQNLFDFADLPQNKRDLFFNAYAEINVESWEDDRTTNQIKKSVESLGVKLKGDEDRKTLRQKENFIELLLTNQSKVS